MYGDHTNYRIFRGPYPESALQRSAKKISGCRNTRFRYRTPQRVFFAALRLGDNFELIANAVDYPEKRDRVRRAYRRIKNLGLLKHENLEAIKRDSKYEIVRDRMIKIAAHDPSNRGLSASSIMARALTSLA